MSDPSHVLGISCYYHDAAASLVRDGEVLAAAQEERFDRVKYSHVFPINAVNYCLQEAGVSVVDIDTVAFYEKPYLKFARTVVGHLNAWPGSFFNFLDMMPSWLEDRLTLPLNLEREMAYEGEVVFLKHHLSHAAAAFYPSPFQEAAILTVDGIGEWASTTYGWGRGNEIRLLREMHYPNSLGLLYAIVCTYLGFRVFTGEGKVMALAAYGRPRYVDRFRQCVHVAEDGSFRLDPGHFSLNRGKRMYNRRFVGLFGPERTPDQDLEERHLDIAASLQAFTEELLLSMARHVQRATGMDRICLGGGVFLNVVANSRILEETPFRDLYILPASGDAGAATGAALYVQHAFRDLPRQPSIQTAALGPSWSADRMRRVLSNLGLPFQEHELPELADRVAEAVADGRTVGWFQGRMEYGPRALGSRSILADPRDPDMREHLNQRVKFREWFRPYGVSVLREQVGDFFEMDRDSPFMLLVGRVRPEHRDTIPSAIHVDGTSRIQTVTRKRQPRYYAVIEAFYRRTGVPMVINTSFNVREPIVCTPEEAVDCFLRSRLDLLALGPFVVRKDQVDSSLLKEPGAPAGTTEPSHSAL